MSLSRSAFRSGSLKVIGTDTDRSAICDFLARGNEKWRRGQGAEIETPKGSRGRGMGRGYPPPHPTIWGERRDLPQLDSLDVQWKSNLVAWSVSTNIHALAIE